jgi:3-hydroxyisobutyrate dehydrogenase-like beta-hydroxyacid dehydrogenase
MASSQVGFIGLGAMGGAMARNLVRAGYAVIGFDLDAARVAAHVKAGGAAGASAADVARRCDVVLTSLPTSETFVRVAEAALLPHARPGQTIIDVGTTTVTETRRLAAALAARGAALIDAPVSGGPGGAAAGTLVVFVGGDDEPAIARSRGVLACIGDPKQVHRAGGSGMGQVLKGVNQLAMGLVDAAYLEAVAFGVVCGADPKLIADAVGGDAGFRVRLRQVAEKASAGEADRMGVKWGQLAYYLGEARARGHELPISDALFRFCENGERTVLEANRPSPSFWVELMKRRGESSSGSG